MLIQNNLHKNYTSFQSGYQLKLPLNLECIISENDSVRLLSQFVEEMDLTDLYSTYERVRENSVSPRTLLKIVLYSYMNGDYSSRSMELNCKRDINFMFLLEGANAPDHATFARFRSIHFAPCSKRIFAEMSNRLYNLGEISGETIFIDGTKIEASSNKYTFVWKKAVSKNQAKLLLKLADLIADCEQLYDIKIVYGNTVKMKHVKKLRKNLYTLKERENLVFVHGIGKRKSPLQKSIEALEEYLAKLKEYNQKIYICGERNSYSKTDHDATFMRMKEDAMRNGQLKPAYNLQHGVDSEYITWLTIGPQPTDTTTLIPFLKEAEEYLKFKYKKIIADAGYESEENYLFIESNGQTSFIKPANYEISKTRKYQQDIGRIENMDYDKEEDAYICRNGKKLNVEYIKHSKSKTGYMSEKTIYKSSDCSGCSYKNDCIKGNNCKTPFEERNKVLQVAKKFIKQRQEGLERILSEEGILLRMNRSIQAEGSFGDLKQDMQFRRYLSKGTSNVLAESVLLAMARNINKLHNKIQNGKTGMHLFPIKSA
ncbi:IS1182 family transposase [Lachnospiraceae bacterium MD1]|uniref:IS1182 family transposase n=1 Tax=Variimorphobacter saccharofermentans TaxID=2755051 RepID=A0A839K0Q1_9FIRM|nr:IS1182 family transposase [Variimorphobacter saccharofermentans]MBB2183495.1 IS1182 family transposase [Variimorphobacter saccharofermentans]